MLILSKRADLPFKVYIPLVILSLVSLYVINTLPLILFYLLALSSVISLIRLFVNQPNSDNVKNKQQNVFAFVSNMVRPLVHYFSMGAVIVFSVSLLQQNPISNPFSISSNVTPSLGVISLIVLFLSLTLALKLRQQSGTTPLMSNALSYTHSNNQLSDAAMSVNYYTQQAAASHIMLSCVVLSYCGFLVIQKMNGLENHWQLDAEGFIIAGIFLMLPYSFTWRKTARKLTKWRYPIVFLMILTTIISLLAMIIGNEVIALVKSTPLFQKQLPRFDLYLNEKSFNPAILTIILWSCAGIPLLSFRMQNALKSLSLATIFINSCYALSIIALIIGALYWSTPLIKALSQSFFYLVVITSLIIGMSLFLSFISHHSSLSLLTKHEFITGCKREKDTLGSLAGISQGSFFILLLFLVLGLSALPYAMFSFTMPFMGILFLSMLNPSKSEIIVENTR